MTRIRPGDSGEDEAKHIARLYRTALEHIARGHTDPLGMPYDPAGELHRIDELLRRHGISWHRTNWIDPYTADDWVNARDAAHYANDVQPGTIRKWAERGHIRVDHDHDGTPLYNIGDLRKHHAKQRQARKDSHRPADLSVPTDRIDRVIENPGNRW